MMDNNRTSQLKRTVKAHIPKDWLCELRILMRIMMETYKGILRTGLMNLAIITTIAAILTIFGTLFRTTISVSAFAKELGSVLEISVYLKSNADIDKSADLVKQISHVDKVDKITKQDAWKKFKKDHDVGDIENPLPDTIRVKVDKPENISETFDKIKKLSFVEDISYAQDIAKKMEVINHAVNTITFIVMIVVAILTITIINNTIQLVIQNKKDEIEIMRLMGVSNWYINTPLILQGAIYGFLGALVALIPLKALQVGLQNIHTFFGVANPVLAANMVVMIIFIIAIGFSAGGSLLSIKKHLQV